jgi:hypothetical protein
MLINIVFVGVFDDLNHPVLTSVVLRNPLEFGWYSRLGLCYYCEY